MQKILFSGNGTQPTPTSYNLKRCAFADLNPNMCWLSRVPAFMATCRCKRCVGYPISRIIPAWYPPSATILPTSLVTPFLVTPLATSLPSLNNLPMPQVAKEIAWTSWVTVETQFRLARKDARSEDKHHVGMVHNLKRNSSMI